jgi:hypothetical protein
MGIGQGGRAPLAAVRSLILAGGIWLLVQGSARAQEQGQGQGGQQPEAQQPAQSGEAEHVTSVDSGQSTEQLAQDLFVAAQEQHAKQNYAEAARLLDASLVQKPLSSPLLLLGDCYEKMGKLRKALDTFQRAADVAVTTEKPDLAHRARLRIAALETRIPRLELRAPRPAPRGLIVTLNGVPMSSENLNLPLPFDAGSYRLEARAPGYQPTTTMIEVSNERSLEGVQVVPIVLTPEPHHFDQRELAWWVGGAGAAVAVTGVIVAIVAKSENSGGSPAEKEDAQHLARVWGTTTLLTSVGLLGTAVGLYITADRADEPGLAGVRWSGQF